MPLRSASAKRASRDLFGPAPATLVFVTVLVGCATDEVIQPAEAEPTEPAVLEVEKVVPSEGLPSEVHPQTSNNNLDIVDHEGRLYMAFRTAPSHFASADTVLYVVSTEDERTWRYETQFAMDTDLREPRFLSFGGQLHLYFAVLGSDPTKFEPQGMRHTRMLGPGSWSEPEPFYDPGFIVWRTRVERGVPYMIAYEGGENLYEPGQVPELQVHLLTTDDGVEWVPVTPGQPAVYVGGGSETDFVIRDDGSLVAVIRSEVGDELGWGSKVCRAPAGRLGEWECVGDKRKYDSPLMFRDGDDVYLIGRRNVTETGNYDLEMRDLPESEQTLAYLTDYWDHPKRCALWRVDQDALAVSFVLDLPSRGDTCFPGLVSRGEGRYLVYNYSSDVEGTDWNWLQGQVRPTYIYRQIVFLPQP
jgi:hypothetical protein